MTHDSHDRAHTFIIAEAGVNHNGDLDLAKRLIDAAAAAGADAVKFQTFKAARLVTASARKAEYQVANTNDDGAQLDMLRALELSEHHHHTLRAHAQSRDIMFLSSPFDIDSMAFLARLGVTIGKIPSGEITNLRFLQAMATHFPEVILSTGMCHLEEVSAALAVLTDAGLRRDQLTILHCNTEYPTPMCDVNLRAMQTIRDATGCRVGYSDHTLGIEVPIAAVALGAVTIEKHITLDRSMPGPDHACSLEPAELAAMVTGIRNIEQALGHTEKRPSPSEQKNRAVARKSLHTATPLPQGHRITEEDLVAMRPGTGLSPMRVGEVVGRRTRRAMDAHETLTEADLEAHP